MLLIVSVLMSSTKHNAQTLHKAALCSIISELVFQITQKKKMSTEVDFGRRLMQQSNLGELADNILLQLRKL